MGRAAAREETPESYRIPKIVFPDHGQNGCSVFTVWAGTDVKTFTPHGDANMRSLTAMNT